MDKLWMMEKRVSTEYELGVEASIQFGFRDGKGSGTISLKLELALIFPLVFSGVILRKISMEEANEILKNNRVEDISWLCSLSESELDLLISIKMLVLQRAKAIGHENLAEKFDLKTLRAIGFVLMEHLKGELRTSDVSDLSQSATLNACNLLDSNVEKILSIDEIMASICSDRRKKPGKRGKKLLTTTLTFWYS
ncbi:hypothetical protein E6C27_scaffold181G001160 [Cucumis melo var. makuwa]|uniref:Uncharacterized protein n=1 Tax=Cucumis melo var. makuwa TaxID=1194695 RepID=A0A5A7UQA1_CUCMM|nr:hypothetical protein E6C27_scaffold181G001160 [Cucumis melo var. makuwa]